MGKHIPVYVTEHMIGHKLERNKIQQEHSSRVQKRCKKEKVVLGSCERRNKMEARIACNLKRSQESKTAADSESRDKDIVALNILQFSQTKAAPMIKKVVESAIANATQITLFRTKKIYTLSNNGR